MVGNLKNYTKIDILRCLLRINKPISRLKLSKELDLGEGTIRSILNILKKNQFLKSNKKGHFMSHIKSKILNKKENKIIIKKIMQKKIFPEMKKVAIHVKSQKNLEKAHVLRDIALKNGAEGAMILKYNSTKKKIELLEQDYNENFEFIEKDFELSDNDLIIIACSSSLRLAEHGALAVVIHLNKKINSILNSLK